MRALLLLATLLLPVAAFGQPDRPAPMTFDPADHRWAHRLLYMFAPTDAHPGLLTQRQLATGMEEGFHDRDLLFITVLERGESLVGVRPMDAGSAEALRERYAVEPGAFVVILVGKDGTEKRRADTPVSVEAVFTQVDQMPMRQREMRERN